MGYSTFMIDDCSRASQETLTPTINAFYLLSSVSNQGCRKTLKTRGAKDSRYIKGRFASEVSEKFFEAN